MTFETNKFHVGDRIRFYSYAYGWRFGRVIGTHKADIGINPSGLWCCTVRFNADDRRGLQEEDHALPQFRLELCDPTTANPRGA
jgi:hypothetical protein